MKVIQQPEETERSIAMINAQVGDVFRVYNHDDIEPIYIMVGVRYDHQALSQSFSTSESVMMARYSAIFVSDQTELPVDDDKDKGKEAPGQLSLLKGNGK